MRYESRDDTRMMRRRAAGPAAMARRHIPSIPRKWMARDMMQRGGTMGMLGKIHDDGGTTALLGCCGPLGSLASPVIVNIGPIAARMIALRKSGKSAQFALDDALLRLHKQGYETVTPEIHFQFAAGTQPMRKTGWENNPAGLGFLGAAPVVAAGATGASAAGTAIGTTAITTAAGAIGAGAAVGQSAIPIPVVGAVIGAAIFEAIHLAQRHVGKAEAAWANPAFYASLRSMNGRDYNEHSFSEAFKGMMDTGNNIVPGCGADRHKDPDCLLGPMAGVIAQGYLSHTVPLTATTAQVFNSVVVPWLKSGVGGKVNWPTLAKEPTQLLMMQAATDRYLAGQAMTRGDMDTYNHQGAHTPSLLQALQPMLAQPKTNTPGTGSPVYSQTPAPGGGTQGSDTQPGQPAPPLPVSGTYPITDYGSPYQPPSGGGAPPIVTPPPGGGPGAMPTTASMLPGGLPNWLMVGIAVLAVGFAVARPMK